MSLEDQQTRIMRKDIIYLKSQVKLLIDEVAKLELLYSELKEKVG